MFIPAHHLQQIIDHAHQGYPYEICGVVGGRDGVAETVISIPNASLNPRVQFEMERQGMVDAIVGLQQIGQEVVAIYHSHPDRGAEPSETDVAHASWPDAVNLIVGLHNMAQVEVQGWLIRYGRATPVDLQVVD
ncbi:MAG: M67 family metallopeptidase [Anaerolineae bacterium]|nr:M67 family metallopeptidase [Anaerolineae bacterium]